MNVSIRLEKPPCVLMLIISLLFWCTDDWSIKAAYVLGCLK